MEKTITPSRFHVPPKKTPASHNDCAAPPDAAIRFSLPFAAKAIERLSGHQKGIAAPSLPASTRALADSSGRTHNCALPPVTAVKASNRPSGEMARELRLLFGGGSRADDTRRGGSGSAAGLENIFAARPIASSVAALVAAIQIRRSRVARALDREDAVAASVTTADAAEGVDTMPSANTRSWAD